MPAPKKIAFKSFFFTSTFSSVVLMFDYYKTTHSLHNRKKRSSNNYLWYSFCFNAFSVQTEFYYFIMIFLLCILIHSFSMLRHTPNADMLMMMLMIFCFVRSDGFSVVLPFVWNSFLSCFMLHRLLPSRTIRREMTNRKNSHEVLTVHIKISWCASLPLLSTFFRLHFFCFIARTLLFSR